MKTSALSLSLASTLLLSGCFFEAGGCSGNGCVYVSDSTGDCYGDECYEPVVCEDANAIAARMAEVVSEARSRDRSCGGVRFAATGPVLWNTRLGDAASGHSADMAENNFLSHTGSDGLSPADRATNAGYNYARIGENIGGGQSTSTAVPRIRHPAIRRRTHCWSLRLLAFGRVLRKRDRQVWLQDGVRHRCASQKARESA